MNNMCDTNTRDNSIAFKFNRFILFAICLVTLLIKITASTRKQLNSTVSVDTSIYQHKLQTFIQHSMQSEVLNNVACLGKIKFSSPMNLSWIIFSLK